MRRSKHRSAARRSYLGLAVAGLVAVGCAGMAGDLAAQGALPDASAPAELVGPAASIKKRIVYQKFVVGNCSGSSTQCTAAITKIGDNKRLEVRNVSCVAQVANPGAGADIWLTNVRSSSAVIYDFYQPVLTQDGSSLDNYAVNADTLFYANAGDTLSIEISAQTNVALLYCKIVGEMVKFK